MVGAVLVIFAIGLSTLPASFSDETILVNQQIKIPVDFANTKSESQPFAYIVQITNDIGQVISVSYITGSLGAGQSLEQTLSYIPYEAGNYKVEKFLWSDLNTPTALTTAPVSNTITVVQSSEQQIQQPAQQTVQTQLSAATSKSSYNTGDTIIISGTASSDSNDPIVIRIYNQAQNLITVSQTYPNSYGVYSQTIQTSEGGVWSAAGIYQIQVDHGEQKVGQVFNFSGIVQVAPPAPPPPTSVVSSSGMNVTVENAAGSSTPGCEPDCFIPSTVTIVEGGQVTFANNDSAAHTSTSGTPADGPTGVWDSSLVMMGAAYTTGPLAAGEYPYLCMVHPWMTGLVIVEGEGESHDDHGHDETKEDHGGMGGIFSGKSITTYYQTGNSGFSMVLEKPVLGDQDYSINRDFNEGVNFLLLESFVSSNDHSVDTLQDIRTEIQPFLNNAQSILYTVQDVNRWNSDGTETNEYIQAWTKMAAYNDLDGLLRQLIERTSGGMNLEAAFDSERPYYVDNSISEMIGELNPPTEPILLSDDLISLSVSTDFPSYAENNEIIISGLVLNRLVNDDTVVHVMITSPAENLISIDQLDVDNSGQFEMIQSTGGGLWTLGGEYTVKANYGALEAETTFNYAGGSGEITPPPPPPPEPTPVPEPVIEEPVPMPEPTGEIATVENAAGSSTPGCEPDCFIPSTVTIVEGGQVTFANNDSAAHTSTSGTPADGPTGVWDSSLVMMGAAYTTGPLAAGEYPYLCMVHPWMTGLVIVEEPPPEPTFINVGTNLASYSTGDMVNITGNSSNSSTTITITITNSTSTLDTLNITSASSGLFATIWQIPSGMESGTYTMTASDGILTNSTSVSVTASAP